MKLAEIHDDFALLDDWEDRYRYVIELGKALPEMSAALKTDANKVRGCACCAPASCRWPSLPS